MAGANGSLLTNPILQKFYKEQNIMTTQNIKMLEWKVTVSGFTPLMFDRYAGDNNTKLPIDKKMYYLEDGKTLAMPAMNIMSFLSAKNTTSVAKVIGGKKWSSLCDATLSYVTISPNMIPILRNGEPIVFHGFENDYDPIAKIFIHKSVARLAKGVPNPKERPVIELPWSISFKISLIQNDVVQKDYLYSAFDIGGKALGMGTFRGVFGKFIVEEWA